MKTISIEDKISRFQAFWARENCDRPLIGFTESYYPKRTLASLRGTQSLLRPQDIDIEAFLDGCERQFEQWRDCTGDGLWSAAPLWGVPWGQAILGRHVLVGTDSIWNDHAKVDWDEIDRLCAMAHNAWLDLLLEIASRLAVRADGRYPISTLITPGILVILAEMRGMSDLVFDMADEPERVEQAMTHITETFLKILDAYFRQVPDWYGGYGSHTRGIWAPGRLIEFDEDSNYLLTPAMQRRFVMPSHLRIVESVEYAYCHLHSTQLHTLDNLLANDAIRYYEICPDEGFHLEELIEVLRKVLDRDRCVITHAFFRVEHVNAMIDSLPPEGLSIGVRTQSADQAAEFQEQIMARRGWC